jgi:hypothetical protein
MERKSMKIFSLKIHCVFTTENYSVRRIDRSVI